MKRGDVVILKENFLDICSDWGVNSEIIPVGLAVLAGEKVYITGITVNGLFIQVNNINISIPSCAVMTLNQERNKKIKEIFDEDRGHGNSKRQHTRNKRSL